MKKVFMLLSMLFTIGVVASFASGDKKINPRIISAFEKDFSFAKNVKWELNSGISFARFSHYDQTFVASYNENAELLSTSRNILFSQLPMAIIRSLEKKYSSYDFVSLIEINNGYETFYLIHAESQLKKLLLKSNVTGDISIVKKTKS